MYQTYKHLIFNLFIIKSLPTLLAGRNDKMDQISRTDLPKKIWFKFNFFLIQIKYKFLVRSNYDSKVRKNPLKTQKMVFVRFRLIF